MSLEQPAGTTSADRVADVIALFATTGHPLRVTDVARTLGLSKAVVHRILQSLTSRSLLRQVPGRAEYMLGPVLSAPTTGTSRPGELRAASTLILRQLRDRTGETTTLSLLAGRERVYVDQRVGAHDVRVLVDLGERLPLHSGASSKAILAFLPGRYVEDAMSQLRAQRPDLDVEEFRIALAEIHRRGYAISRNERGTGAVSVAAPVFGPDRDVLGSISSSRSMSCCEDDLREGHARLVISAARAITARLDTMSTPLRPSGA